MLSFPKVLFAVLAVLFFCLPVLKIPSVQAADMLLVKTKLDIFSISEDEYLRNNSDTKFPLDSLKNNEYVSFSFELKNNASTPYTINSMYVTVNRVEKIRWDPVVVPAKTTLNYHLNFKSMQEFGKGTFTVSLFINEKKADAKTFTFTEGKNNNNNIVSTSTVQNAGMLLVKTKLDTFSISEDEYLKNNSGTKFSLDSLKNNEYVSFSFELKNNASTPYTISSMYVTVNRVVKMRWDPVVVPAKTTLNYHLNFKSMQEFGKGTFTVSLFINEKKADAKTFTFTEANNNNNIVSTPIAPAADMLSVNSVLNIYNISNNNYLRNNTGTTFALDSLNDNEYVAFAFDLKNDGSTPYRINSIYVTVNREEKIRWVPTVIPAKTTSYYHFDYNYMKEYGKGTYLVSLYINDKRVDSKTYLFTGSKNITNNTGNTVPSSFSGFIEGLKRDGVIKGNGTVTNHDDFTNEWAQLGWYQWYHMDNSNRFVLGAHVSWDSASLTPNTFDSGCGVIFNAGQNSVDNHLLASVRMDGLIYINGFRNRNWLSYGNYRYGSPSTKGEADFALVVDNDKASIYINGNRIVRKAELPVMGDEIALCTLSGTNLDYGTRCTWKDFFVYKW